MIKSILRLFNVKIPLDQLIITHSKSSGPGGQHVNKTNSKVHIRFNIDSCNWLTDELKESLKEKYSHFINKENEFFIQSQSNKQTEFREQKNNETDAIEKLQNILNKAAEPKTVRNYKDPEETPEKKVKRVKTKRVKSEIKSLRREKFDFRED